MGADDDNDRGYDNDEILCYDDDNIMLNIVVVVMVTVCTYLWSCIVQHM